MIIKLLKKLFSIVIGELPPEQKALFWARFNTLMIDVVKAATEGAVKGMKE